MFGMLPTNGGCGSRPTGGASALLVVYAHNVQRYVADVRASPREGGKHDAVLQAHPAHLDRLKELGGVLILRGHARWVRLLRPMPF